MKISLILFLALSLLFMGCKTDDINLLKDYGIPMEKIQDEEVREAIVKFISKYDTYVKLTWLQEKKTEWQGYKIKNQEKIIKSINPDNDKKLEIKSKVGPVIWVIAGVALGALATWAGMSAKK